MPYWGGEVDCCINAWTVANGVWLGADVGGIVDWFVEHRMPDGGWNCAWVEGPTRSSFRSTLSALKGLLAWEIATGGTDASRAARRGVPAAARSVPAPVDWMADAIGLVRAARQPDGTWLQSPGLEGGVWFDVDVPEGQPSKWLTLYGTHVLEWWDAAR